MQHLCICGGKAEHLLEGARRLADRRRGCQEPPESESLPMLGLLPLSLSLA